MQSSYIVINKKNLWLALRLYLLGKLGCQSNLFFSSMTAFRSAAEWGRCFRHVYCRVQFRNGAQHLQEKLKTPLSFRDMFTIVLTAAMCVKLWTRSGFIQLYGCLLHMHFVLVRMCQKYQVVGRNSTPRKLHRTIYSVQHPNHIQISAHIVCP